MKRFFRRIRDFATGSPDSSNEDAELTNERKCQLNQISTAIPDYLKTLYKERFGMLKPEPWEAEHSTRQFVPFTSRHPRLQIALTKSTGEVLELSLPSGDVTNELFSARADTRVRCACIKGSIDTGKTTMIRKIALDWVGSEPYVNKYKTVYAADLEDLNYNGDQSFLELLAEMLPSGGEGEKLTAKEIEYILESNSNDESLFLLDNIDLVDDELKRAEIVDFLEEPPGGDKTVVVVTCRRDRVLEDLEVEHEWFCLRGMTVNQAKRNPFPSSRRRSSSTLSAMLLVSKKSSSKKKCFKKPPTGGVQKVPGFLIDKQFVKPLYLKIYDALYMRKNSRRRPAASIPAMLNDFMYHVMGEFTGSFIDSVTNYHVIGELCILAQESLRAGSWKLADEQLNEKSGIVAALLEKRRDCERRFCSKSIHTYLAGLGVVTPFDNRIPFDRVSFDRIDSELEKFGKLFLASIVHSLDATGNDAWRTLIETVLDRTALPTGCTHGLYCACAVVTRQLLSHSASFWCPEDDEHLLTLANSCVVTCRNYDVYFHMQRLMTSLVPGVGLNCEATLELMSSFLSPIVYLNRDTSPVIQALVPVLLARQTCPIEIIFLCHTFNMTAAYKDRIEDGLRQNRSVRGIVAVTVPGVTLQWTGYRKCPTVTWFLTLAFTTDEDFYHLKADDKKRFRLLEKRNDHWHVTGRSLGIEDLRDRDAEEPLERLHLRLPAERGSSTLIAITKLLKHPYPLTHLYLDGGAPDDPEDYTNHLKNVIPNLRELRLGSLIRSNGHVDFVRVVRLANNLRTVQVGVDMNNTSRNVCQSIGQLVNLTGFHAGLNTYHWPTTLGCYPALADLTIYLKNDEQTQNILDFMNHSRSRDLRVLRLETGSGYEQPEVDDVTAILDSIGNHENLISARLCFLGVELSEAQIAQIAEIIGDHIGLVHLSLFTRNSATLLEQEELKDALRRSVRPRFVETKFTR
ncbi:uncharacterized protein LOC141911295 [Tubulanus polymorphus]|uniref:uncharacterized protein LOC141911295 n=1 Tax=Tubulanus polymorphus TaxID=672921 RepID=UPI003DA65CBA